MYLADLTGCFDVFNFASIPITFSVNRELSNVIVYNFITTQPGLIEDSVGSLTLQWVEETNILFC